MRVSAVVSREHDHYVIECLNVGVISLGETLDVALASLQRCLVMFMRDEPGSVRLEIDGQPCARSRLRLGRPSWIDNASSAGRCDHRRVDRARP